MRRNFLVVSALIFSFTLTMNAQNNLLDSEPWSMRMTKSEMIRCPESWQLDFHKTLKWDYCQGLELGAMLDVDDFYNVYRTKDSTIYKYVKDFGGHYVHADGSIETYNKEEYTLDAINTGKILFRLFDRTKDEKYKKAQDLLRNQFYTHPRTSEGGFWHKKTYPSQMWLDGIYMASPFYAEYAYRNNEPKDYADVIKQFLVVDDHTYDRISGLNRHAWDESKQQKWADPATGMSAHCWGRAYGWYGMALVDALDFIPVREQGRIYMLNILFRVAQSLEEYQDKKTGLWYQVMDMPHAKGNYLESSCSAMFIYTLLKGIRMGYLPEHFKKMALKAYKGYLKNFIEVDSKGLVTVTHACSVAGLGGKPYRSGSFEYYIGEKQRDNDPKAVGPFIKASLEVERLEEQKKW